MAFLFGWLLAIVYCNSQKLIGIKRIVVLIMFEATLLTVWLYYIHVVVYKIVA